MSWILLKSWLSDLLLLEKDALHVYAALAIQIAAALLLRRGLDDIRPLGFVLAFELLNEWFDYRFEVWPERGMQVRAGLHDVINTMLLPLCLWAVVRYRPAWLAPGRGRGSIG